MIVSELIDKLQACQPNAKVQIAFTHSVPISDLTWGDTTNEEDIVSVVDLVKHVHLCNE